MKLSNGKTRSMEAILADYFPSKAIDILEDFSHPAPQDDFDAVTAVAYPPRPQPKTKLFSSFALQ